LTLGKNDEEAIISFPDNIFFALWPLGGRENPKGKDKRGKK
jgi:hypothetical protein